MTRLLHFHVQRKKAESAIRTLPSDYVTLSVAIAGN
jgi:hypothetical protein